MPAVLMSASRMASNLLRFQAGDVGGAYHRRKGQPHEWRVAQKVGYAPELLIHRRGDNPAPWLEADRIDQNPLDLVVL
jgi:hypothetical protein